MIHQLAKMKVENHESNRRSVVEFRMGKTSAAGNVSEERRVRQRNVQYPRLRVGVGPKETQ